MSNIDKIDIPAELDKAISEIAEQDARTDQFRSVKALLLYQCQLLEMIVGLLNAPVYGGEDGKET